MNALLARNATRKLFTLANASLLAVSLITMTVPSAAFATQPSTPGSNHSTSISIDTVNGGAPGLSCDENPITGEVTVAGSGAGTAPPGNIEQYGVAIDWGDGNTSDPVSSDFTPATGHSAFTFTYSGSHTYASDGSHTVTATVYHQTLDGGDNNASTSTLVCTASQNEDPSVTTDLASNITEADATLNGTLGPVDATDSSFWVSQSPGIDVSNPNNIPSGVASTPVLGPVSAGDFFTAQLSTTTTNGIPNNLPLITPDTDYYYVAWAYVNGNWIHGEEQHFKTLSAEEVPTCNLVSDTDTKVTGPDDTPLHSAVLVSQIHSAWTHLLDSVGASWIWGEDPVANTEVDETEVFTKTFHMTGSPASATLDIAADNGYKIEVNGTEVVDLLNTEFNYGATTTYNVMPYLDTGANNTLTITVKNIGVQGSDESTNPAGLDYLLHIDNATCTPASSVIIPPHTTDVTVCKEDENGNKLPDWQLTLRKADAIGSVDVSSSDGSGVEQTIPGVGAGHYVARATGVYHYRNDPVASTSDAAFSYRLAADGYTGPYFPWIRENDFNPPYQGWLGVMINDSYTDWGSIFNPNPSHKYWTNLSLATTTDLNFNILDDQYGDNDGSLHVDVFKGFTGVTSENGCTTFTDVPYGDYQLHEIHKPGWTRIDDNHHVTVNGTSNHFTVVNDDGKSPKVNVVATKIICDSETDLPNLGGANHVTDANTASDFLESHPDCHAAPDWHFEWANQDGANSGGDYIGDYGNGYTDFGPTDENGVATTTIPLANLSEVHLREVLQDGYIPFSDNNGDHPDVSAEFYCSDDGLNYDNWDFIRNPQDGNTYYCVAWNAPKTSSVTMCKYNTNEQPLAGWNLWLKGDHVEDLVVPVDTSSGIDTATDLVPGDSYLATAVGTWLNQGGANPVDAEYSTTDNWATHMDGYDGYQTDILELQINSSFDPNSNWGTYNAAHTYEQSFVPSSTSANFRIFDGVGTTQYDGTNDTPNWFSDNSGSLAVAIDKGYAGVTNDDGCVTFDNVPYGTYTAGETAQDGWSNYSGTGEVTVDEPTKTFTVVNQQITEPTGHIVVDKVTDPAEDPTSFHFNTTGDGYQEFDLTDQQAPNDQVLAVGDYSVSEVETEGWDSDGGNCVSNQDYEQEPDDIVLHDGETVTCTFTNTEQGGGDGGGATLHIVKDTTGGDGEFTFDLAHNESNDQYQVQTTEGTGESDAIDLTPGVTYDLSEAAHEGWDLTSKGCSVDDSEAHVGNTFSIDGPIEFTPGEGENITCTFHNTNKGDEVDNNFVVKAVDLFDGSVIDALSSDKWFMYNDTTDVIDDSLGSFVDGPDTAPLGDGSIEFVMHPATQQDDIATFKYQGTALSDITSLEFSAYSHSGISGPNESPYLVLNVDFNGSNTWQKRLVYVPSANGSVPQDTWNTYDTIDGGNGLWWWSGYAANGNKWPDGNPNEYRTWNDLMSAFPNASILTTGGLLGVRVGEPGPVDYTGDIDNFVIGITDGTTITTDTYDFEPTSQNNNGGGGGGGHGGGTQVQGQVEGASTEGQVLGASCDTLLTTYMKMDWASNLVDEVTKLQNFLNSNLGIHLPVTGYFGSLTDSAVKQFQVKYGDDVLKPWIGIPGSGITNTATGTGYVFKTTQWKINMLNCPDLNLPFPTLP